MTVEPLPARPRPTELRLARLHLRLGALELARAELEAAAGEAALDDEALLDLAEIRWRTGDLPGAGVAAQAYLSEGREDVLGLVIAAEAAGAAGHTLEARRLASRALEVLDTPLDGLFAGMPRGPFWPLEPDVAAEPAGVLFATATPAGPVSPPESSPEPIEAEPPAETAVAPATTGGIGGQGLWSEAELPVVTRTAAPPSADDLAPAADALAAGDDRAAADALAELLRRRPDLSAAILGALGRQPPDEPGG